MKKIILIIILIIINLKEVSAFYLVKNIESVLTTREDCKIAQVDDGDTIDLDCNTEYYPNVRLLGINAPDKNQKNSYEHCYYEQSRDILQLIKKREISVVFYGSDLCRDEYKGCRNLVRLIDKETGNDINELLITKGFAFSWTQFSSIPIDLKLNYIKAERIAKDSRSGLWAKCEVKYNEYATIDSGIPGKMTN